MGNGLSWREDVPWPLALGGEAFQEGFGGSQLSHLFRGELAIVGPALPGRGVELPAGLLGIRGVAMGGRDDSLPVAVAVEQEYPAIDEALDHRQRDDVFLVHGN